jgi:signal transduction histidine kinase
MIRAAAEQKEQSLEVEVEPSLPQIVADPARIQQVLSNLLENANKYTQEGGRIEIGARQIGQEVEIAVSDNGPGIPEHHLDDIFERFTRGDASETQLIGGTGLGLAIAKSLAKAMGGDLNVRSVLGQGTTFTIRLPHTPAPTRPLQSHGTA